MATSITLTRPPGCGDMFDSDLYSDVHIVGHDDWQEIKAHRVILSAGSEEFSRMFTGHASINGSIVFFNKFKRIDLYRALQLIYTGKTDVPEDDLPEFLNVCKTLKIKDMPDDLKAENGLMPDGPNEPPNNGSPGPSANNETRASNGHSNGSSDNTGPSVTSSGTADNRSTSGSKPPATDDSSSLKSSPIKRKLNPESDAASTSEAVLPVKSEMAPGASKKQRVSGSDPVNGITIKAELADVKPEGGSIKDEDGGVEGEHSMQSLPLLAPDGDRTKCLLCAKTFASVGAGRTHIKEKHSDKQKKVKCHICPSEFAVPRYLQSHLKKQHQITQQMLKKAFK